MCENSNFRRLKLHILVRNSGIVYTNKKDFGQKQAMISKQQTTYALEFFGKSIILLSSTDEIHWRELGLADMGDPDFREMMKDFHAVVGKHGLRKAKVALFLPLEDVALRTIGGDDTAQALANDAGVAVDEIGYAQGNPDADDQYNAVYAYRDTLKEAAGFVAQFGFSATYFSARIPLDGFSEQPKIYLTSKVKATAPLALWSGAAVTAVVAAAAISILYSTSATEPTSTLQLSSVTQPTPAPTPTSAKVIMASMTQSVVTPIVTTTFDAKNLDITPINVITPSKLMDFTVSTADIAPQTIVKAAIATDTSLPVLDALTATPLTLSALSATAQAPVIAPTTDNVTAPFDTAPILTDAAVPEDANYPRPKRRPGAAPIEAVVTVEPVKVASATTSTTPRPPRRPTGLRSNTTTTQTAIAQDLVQQAIEKDAAAASSIKSASARAIGTNKRPPLKTSNFRNIVKRAAAKPTPTVTTTTKTVAVSKPTTTKAPAEDKSTRAATTFSKGALSLVGVFGTPSKRSALFRTSAGGYRSVKIGQRVAGWKVVSISESSAKVTKGSRTKTMRLP
jgi:hypothetical protein